MPFKGSRRHHANHHGNRQNGLAQPGKKIEKPARQRSNGQLNTSAAITTQAHLPSTSRRTSKRHGSLTGSDGAFTEGAQSREDLVAAGDDSETHEGFYNSQEEILEQDISTSARLDGQQPRRIDVNAAGNPAVHVDRGPLFFAITILRSCPLADTLALLIILLQIPAALLTVVNLLYVALTFVPSTTSNIPSLPSLAYAYQGSGGMPSFVTVALTDVLFFVGWMFLWTPLQDLTLDLAQAVIAVSLGGRLTSRQRGLMSTLMCLGIVILSHFGRCKCLQLPSSSTFLPARSPHVVRFTPWWLSMKYPTFNPQGGWLRTLLAVHVLAQATVRVFRQLLLRPEKSISSNTHMNRQSDGSTPSATNMETSGNRTMTINTIEFDRMQSQPTRTPGPNPRNLRDREAVAQKMRRQGMYVRIFQPLWAAVASTKTIMLREYYSRNNEDAVGAAARDANNLGNASFQSEEGRVWATRITTTEISLETSFFDPVVKPTTESENEDVEHANDSTAAATAPPFYVLVNREMWPSIRVSEVKKDHSGNDDKIGHWAIEIYGLKPGSNYTCIIVRSENNHIVTSMHLTTQQISAPDAACASPRTALKRVLAAAEAKLEEEKTSIKKIRKEHKVQTSGLKKEVDASNARFVHSGSNDDRQRQRLLQIGQHIRQAEDAAAHVSSQTEAMGQVPEHDLSDCRESKESWDTIRRRHSKALAELNESARQSGRQIAAIQTEAANLQQKRERVQARQNKLKDQYERLSNAKTQDLSGNDLTTVVHTSKDEQRQITEQQFIRQSQNLHDSLKEIQLDSQQLWQQVHAIEAACLDQQQRANSAPTTPEGNLPGTMMGNRNPPSARFGNFVFPSGLPTKPIMPSRTTPGHRDGRARSSSMLSNVSGLTDQVDFPVATGDRMMVNEKSFASHERTRNDGAYGGRRSRSGSHRDPSSPFPNQQSSPFAVGKGTSPVWR